MGENRFMQSLAGNLPEWATTERVVAFTAAVILAKYMPSIRLPLPKVRLSFRDPDGPTTRA